MKQPAALSAAMLDQAIAGAARLQAEGRPQAALEACTKVLRADPGHAGANHLLGLLLHQAGRNAEAITALRKAVDRDPGNAVYRSNIGVVLKAAGRLDEAVASYEAALRLDPGLAQVQSNLGVALLGLGQIDAAIAAHREAIARDPDYPEAHANLGMALAEAGDADGAIACFERAVALNPNYANAYVQLAIALQGAGRPDEARAAAERAVALNPMQAAAHHALANVLRALDLYGEAIASYRRALQLQPEATAYRNLARALYRTGSYEESAAAARASLDLDPDDPATHLALADALTGLGRHAKAVPVLRRAVELDPDNSTAQAQLAMSLIDTADAAGGIELLRDVHARHPEQLFGRTTYLFTLNYFGSAPIPEMVAEAKRYGDMLAARAPARTHHDNTPDPERRLKLGLVSGDLRQHAVARFLLSVLPELRRDELELFAYQTRPDSDDFTDRFKTFVPNWRDVSRMGDAQLDALIVADGIDILVDLSGLSAYNRLPVFARKPAPVAATWIGYFATTGLRAIDYVLSTRWVIPPEEENQWVEKPWLLPETYLCFARPNVDVPVGPPPMLANGFVTFGSANNINKLSDATVACWAAVLHAVPGSRLLLRAAALASERVADAVRARFATYRIEPERLLLQRGVPSYDNHLARYGDVDIALDPFPYAGGTTSVESLWMGVPVLTRKGDRYVAHMGENILHNVAMPEWIASDTADYVRKAAAFAADPTALAELRTTLRPRLAASPLMDAPRFARNLEAAFRGMWRKWCADQAAHK